MATVINNPGEGGSGAGVIVGLVVAVVLIAVVFIYGLPALRNGTTNETPSANVDINLPGANTNTGGDTGY
jgi:hypothetical protein